MGILSFIEVGDYDLRDYIFFLQNLAIIMGYLTAAVTVAFLGKIIPPATSILSGTTRFFGVNFFVTCALTHVELAGHIITQTPLLNASSDKPIDMHLLVIHGWQAAAILLFLTFLYRDIISTIVAFVKRNSLEDAEAIARSEE